MKLEISLFKFDKNSDYLPYYTKHFIKVKEEKTLLDILNNINEEAKLDYVACEGFDLVVNGVYIKAGITLEELTKTFGNEITIEPISIRRACHDLLINDDDFNEKLEVLSEFITEEDKKEYQNLKQYYYASNTLNYNIDYIGDSVLILASKIMERSSNEVKNEILKTIFAHEVGAQNYTSLKNRIYKFDETLENRIIDLQKGLKFYQEIEKQNYRINNTLKFDFGSFEEKTEIKHDFKDFNFAYYNSTNDSKYQDLVNNLSANILKLPTLKLDLAKNTFNVNPNITYFVAYTILLDAFDNNADFLLVDNDEDFYIFDYNRKQFEKMCGREVILPVIHINELQKLASGNHDEVRKTLEKHQINPEII